MVCERAVAPDMRPGGLGRLYRLAAARRTEEQIPIERNPDEELLG
jgi:hypothetical protein